MHQNLPGDTALHAVALCGNTQGANGIYRLFQFDNVSDDYRDAEHPGAEEYE
jgi:hypothetical protein